MLILLTYDFNFDKINDSDQVRRVRNFPKWPISFWRRNKNVINFRKILIEIFSNLTINGWNLPKLCSIWFILCKFNLISVTFAFRWPQSPQYHFISELANIGPQPKFRTCLMVTHMSMKKSIFLNLGRFVDKFMHQKIS